ncbi:MAG TPA: RNA polymerase subunit sigma-70 [Pseudobacteroides sp.]|uniref:RNA polymerase subunit sigma-70 n=1 Tax=Pseudobacteroides sp. TaxID=1968840 RepID=UPI002F92880F
MNDIQKEQIKRLRLDGMGYIKVAQTLGLSENTVKSYCRRNNIPRNEVGGVAPQDNICLHCGNPIVQKEGTKKRKFCTDDCRQTWWNSHLDKVTKKAVYTLTCSYCGKDFESYGNKNRRYCCHDCYITDRFGKVGDGK